MPRSSPPSPHGDRAELAAAAVAGRLCRLRRRYRGAHRAGAPPLIKLHDARIVGSALHGRSAEITVAFTAEFASRQARHRRLDLRAQSGFADPNWTPGGDLGRTAGMRLCGRPALALFFLLAACTGQNTTAVAATTAAAACTRAGQFRGPAGMERRRSCERSAGILSARLRRADAEAGRSPDGRRGLCRHGGRLARRLRRAPGRCARFLRKEFHALCRWTARRCSPAIMSRKSAAAARAHGAFQTPVYGLPADLVRADLGLFNPKLQGEHISGRLEGRRLVPYADRAPKSTPRASAGAGAVLYRRPDRLFLPADSGLGPGRVRRWQHRCASPMPARMASPTPPSAAP